MLLLPARASVGGGCATATAMPQKPARRPSRARRYPAENVIGYATSRGYQRAPRGCIVSAGVRAVAKFTGRPAAMINDAAGCCIGWLIGYRRGGRFCERRLRLITYASLFASNGYSSLQQRCLCRRSGQVDRARDRSSRAENEPTRISKSTASAGRKTHGASHLQQRTSPSRKRSTHARPRRATPWLSRSKPGGGAPPAASRSYSLSVNAPTPSRCRGDRFAEHDGRNSG